MKSSRTTPIEKNKLVVYMFCCELLFAFLFDLFVLLLRTTVGEERQAVCRVSGVLEVVSCSVDWNR